VVAGHPRKDALRNREAILDAARRLFAESTDVAMCEVARQAGVGQATLYRNFADRTELAAEVFNEYIERFEALAAECLRTPGTFFVLLRHLVLSVAEFYTLGDLARRDARVGSQLDRIRNRIADLIRQPLDDAKKAGRLRRDASVDDVFLILLMARGAMERTSGPEARAVAATRVLTIALDGLR
jgi:AcrR family transcriptional regulator